MYLMLAFTQNDYLAGKIRSYWNIFVTVVQGMYFI